MKPVWLAVPLILIGAPLAALAAVDPPHDLARLCDEYWQGTLRFDPTEATAIGDHRYDSRLEDDTPAGIEANRRWLESIRARARKIDATDLAPADRLTRGALLVDVDEQLDRITCHFEDWNLSPLGGPQVGLMNLADYTRIADQHDAGNYVARLRAMGPYLDVATSNLRAGLRRGRVASEPAARKVLGQLEALAAMPAAEWPLVAPAKEERAAWTPAQRQRFEKQVVATVEQIVKPAMGRYEAVVRNEVLPHARPAEHPGLASLPGGPECYARLIRVHTSLDKTPAELHQLGLDEIARIRRELSVLGKKVLGTSDVVAIQKRLRTDPAMHFRTGAEVEAKAREALARAQKAIPKVFGRLPKAPCVVKVMGMHEAPQSTIAYYREPAMDGSRPGTYMINTYLPETRPRYEAEVLAFHESIPGHHLQIAIAQELTGIPEFRKHNGVTAFVEGWGLYSERLADEMKLYSSDVDRIGMLSFDAWRASRLVVDTGMHAMGWSRQQAIDYMTQNTVLAENNIENEVDRYITSPGQALAYKVGQLEILALRDEAKKRLGRRFDIRKFHDVVLENGALPLPMLRQQVEAYATGEAQP